jgi:hypothetical protein
VTGLTTTDSPVFGTVKLSGLTDGYIPKHTSDAVGLVNSPIYTDGTNVGIGNSSPVAKLEITGGLFATGGVTFYKVSSNIPSNNGLVLGAASKSVSGTGGQGQIEIVSNDAANRLEAYIGLNTSASESSRYLSMSIVEQGVGYRNIVTQVNGGNFSVGTASPASKLSVAGNLSVGASYAAIAAPANGAIFEGNVGIGESSPAAPLVITKGSSLGSNNSILVAPLSGGLGRGSTILFSATFNLAWGGADFGYRDSAAIRYLPNETTTEARNHRLAFFTNTIVNDTPVEKMSIHTSGNIAIGVIATPTAMLDINSDILRLRTAKTPASASASGNAGDICWDASGISVCTATNTWKKTLYTDGTAGVSMADVIALSIALGG